MHVCRPCPSYDAWVAKKKLLLNGFSIVVYGKTNAIITCRGAVGGAFIPLAKIPPPLPKFLNSCFAPLPPRTKF